MRTKSVAVACWLEPGFGLLEVASVLQVLSLAGSRWNWRPFRIMLCSSQGGLIASSAQAAVSTLPLASVPPPELILLTKGSPRQPANEVEELFSWLANVRESPLENLVWVGLGRGVCHLVQVGLCQGRTIAAPHSERAQLTAADGSIRFTEEPWYQDGPVLSSAAVETIPVGLRLVEHFFGRSACRAAKNELGLTTCPISVAWPDDIPLPKA